MFRKTLFARYLTLLILALLSTNLAWGGALEDGYTKITDISSLSAGDEVVLYCDDSSSGVTGYSGSDATVSTTALSWMKFTVEKSGNCYYLKNSDGKYITKQTNNKFTITATTATGNECTVNTDGVLCINGRYLVKNSNYYRMYTSVGSYKGVFVYKVVTSAKTLKSIAISGTPDKTTYETGESFDVTGLTVIGTYDDASTADLTSSAKWTINPATFTSTSQNSVSVTATVDGKSDTKSYDVTVNEHIVTPGEYTISLNNALYGIGTGNNGTEQSKKVNDITIVSGCKSNAGTKTNYQAGHIRYYADSYLKLSVPAGYEITSVVFTEPSSDKTWNGSITSTPDAYNADTKTWTGKSQNVEFSFGAQNRAASITVTYIRNKTLDHIGVAGTQTSFFVGDEFKHDEMKVTAYYDDETSEDVTSLATFSNPDMTSPGEKTVTVTYNEKTASYKINVQAVVLTSVEVSGEPTKKEYYVGESFNTAGLVVTGHYNNGTQATITEGITWKITPETFIEPTEDASVTVTAKVGDVTSEDFEVTGLTVTSPESAYTLTAQPAEGGSYKVTVGDDPAKTVTSEAIEFKVTEGTVIQVEATANEHYKVHSTPFEGKYADETPISFGKTGVGNKRQFTYGTADAIITAKFIRMYAVNIDENIEHGTVVADPVENTPSSVITLTLTPDAHYHFKSVTVKDKNGDNIATDTPETKDNITTTKFQMPLAEAKKGDVSVTATFEEDPKYTVTFSVNGVNTKSEPNYANTPVEFPEVEDVAGYTFIGWTTGPIAKTQDTKPETIIEAVYPKNNDKVHYAFFAEKEEDTETKEFSFTVQTSDFNTTSYDANNGSHDFTATCTTDDTKQITIACTTNQIMKQSEAMQWQKGKGYIYNTTDLGTIKSVEISNTEGTFTTYYGTTEHPESGTTVGNGFFTVKVGSNETGKTSSVVVTFEKEEQIITYSNYRTFVTHVPVTINKFVEKDEGNASFCSEFDLDFTGMDAEDKENKIGAYIGKDVVEGETAVLNLLGIDKVPAGTGIFVIGTPGTYAVPICEETLTELGTGVNSLVGTTAEFLVETAGIYALSNKDGLLHPVNTGVTIGVGKAYYRLPEDASSVSVLTLAIIDEPTGITSYENENVNDNKSTAVYNLQGMRVMTPKKGEIYIMNGKKFLMK